jgi:hypothetical protein
MKNIFKKQDSLEIIERINKLTPSSTALWGKMDVAKMLAHCNVTYEFIYTDKHPKPNPFTKLILRLFVKKLVVSNQSYKKNNPTAPAFIIANEKEFETEKNNLINYITTTQELGESHFDGKESHSFGKLNKTEWNNMFYKHLDHHLSQFGV